MKDGESIQHIRCKSPSESVREIWLEVITWTTSTRGRVIGKLEEERTVTQCSCRVRNQQKVSLRALRKRVPNHRVQLIERLVVAAQRRQLQG
ncbi:hypothetical protein TNCV_895561 [Trichonephila clavipes]|nr:hypothetical protein TNCV_895561 [Trichonephila clavipes]